MIDLPHLTVSGSPRVMGQQQGEHYKALIAEFVDVRFNALAGYLSDRKTKDTGLFETAEACMRLHESWDNDGILEHMGIAEGSNIDPVRLYIATNMTDIRDILVLPATPDQEGCSSVLLPGNLTADAYPIAGQTWDLNPRYRLCRGYQTSSVERLGNMDSKLCRVFVTRRHERKGINCRHHQY